MFSFDDVFKSNPILPPTPSIQTTPFLSYSVPSDFQYPPVALHIPWARPRTAMPKELDISILPEGMTEYSVVDIEGIPDDDIEIVVNTLHLEVEPKLVLKLSLSDATVFIEYYDYTDPKETIMQSQRENSFDPQYIHPLVDIIYSLKTQTFL